jgi:hypothetical protein
MVAAQACRCSKARVGERPCRGQTPRTSGGRSSAGRDVRGSLLHRGVCRHSTQRAAAVGAMTEGHARDCKPLPPPSLVLVLIVGRLAHREHTREMYVEPTLEKRKCRNVTLCVCVRACVRIVLRVCCCVRQRVYSMLIACLQAHQSGLSSLPGPYPGQLAAIAS